MKKYLIIGVCFLFLFIVVFGRADSNKDVEELLACSLRIARDLENTIERTATLVYIAMKCSDIGQNDKASKTLSQAFRSAMKVDDTSEKDKMLSYVAGKYAKTGLKMDDKTKEILTGIDKNTRQYILLGNRCI